MTKEQGTLFDGLGPVMPAKLSAHPLYSVASSMRDRCDNPNSPDFHWYGGRGITVCDEWRRSRRAFIAWALANGWRPGLQIDRIDNDGPYSPGNCRFVSPAANSANRRCAVRLADGRPAWTQAQRNGVSRSAFANRLRRGWTPEQAAGIAPAPQRLACVRLSDGRAAWPQAQRNGVSRTAFYSRLHRGWTPEQAAGIAPPPQRPLAVKTVYEKQAAADNEGGTA